MELLITTSYCNERHYNQAQPYLSAAYTGSARIFNGKLFTEHNSGRTLQVAEISFPKHVKSACLFPHLLPSQTITLDRPDKELVSCWEGRDAAALFASWTFFISQTWLQTAHSNLAVTSAWLQPIRQSISNFLSFKAGFTVCGSAKKQIS